MLIDAGGNKTWYSHFGRLRVVSYQIKRTVLWPCNSACAPWSSGVENWYSQTRTTADECLKQLFFFFAKRNKIFLSKWMDKLWYIHTMKYYCAKKIHAVSSHGMTERNLKIHITKWKKPIWKDYICLLPTMWLSGKSITVETGVR